MPYFWTARWTQQIKILYESHPTGRVGQIESTDYVFRGRRAYKTPEAAHEALKLLRKGRWKHVPRYANWELDESETIRVD